MEKETINIPKGLQTIFSKGKKLSYEEHSAMFISWNEEEWTGSIRNCGLIQELKSFGVFLTGVRESVFIYLFLKDYIIEYLTPLHTETVNGELSGDWTFKKDNPKIKVFLWEDVEEFNLVYGDKSTFITPPITYEKKGNIAKGVVIGEILGGYTGALIGGLTAASSSKTVTIGNASKQDWEKLYLNFKYNNGDRSIEVKNICLATVYTTTSIGKNQSSKTIGHFDFTDKANYALVPGFNAYSISNQTVMGTLSSILEKCITEGALRKQKKIFWDNNPKLFMALNDRMQSIKETVKKEKEELQKLIDTYEKSDEGIQLRQVESELNIINQQKNTLFNKVFKGKSIKKKIEELDEKKKSLQESVDNKKTIVADDIEKRNGLIDSLNKESKQISDALDNPIGCDSFLKAYKYK